MAGETRTWLISNPASKSNRAEVLEELQRECARCGFVQVGHTVFPQDELPSPAQLDDAGVGLLTIFTGDGTINAALTAVAGWSGQVLVLPGGTMNMLYHRLFGGLELEEALEAVAAGRARPRRPGVIRCAHGTAYAGVLAGPGTAWGDVREELRDMHLVDAAAEALDAFVETLEGDPAACLDPPWGRREGYPLLVLTPHDEAFEINAYHAENAAEFLEQLAALVQREFREGPHDLLGRTTRATLGSVEGSALPLLLDGEPHECGAQVQFELVPCDVDLLATRHDGR